MDSYFERLAPSNAPEPWLAVISPGTEDYVVRVAPSEEELDIEQLEKQWINWIRLGHKIVAVRDSPALSVQYRAGLYQSGDSGSAAPAQLAARRNWFLRYRSILERHLSNPLPSLVQFYQRRPPQDLLCTLRSTESGPFPFPKDADWPRCGHCRERMAFIGVLDFREYHRIGKARVPRGSLALHGCDQCTIPCSDAESTSLAWLTEGEVEWWRGEKGSEDAIEVGIAWETLEFPPPAFYARDLSDDPVFQKEHGIYENFTCPFNKVGGHLHWIQDDCTPNDRESNPMQYIGQFIGSRDVVLGDAGIVYVFWSDRTRETRAVLQYY